MGSLAKSLRTDRNATEGQSSQKKNRKGVMESEVEEVADPQADDNTVEVDAAAEAERKRLERKVERRKQRQAEAEAEAEAEVEEADDKAARKAARKASRIAAKAAEEEAAQAQEKKTQLAAEDNGDEASIAAARAAKKAARKIAKKQAKKDRVKSEKEAAAAERANREARNKHLREKGKLTKKEKYLAEKAKRKAKQMQDAKEAFEQKRVAEEASEPAEATGKKLDARAVECFLTGLPFTATEEHIADHFAKVGCCSVEILRDENDKPNGKAFITFDTAKEAMAACALHESRIQKRWIGVRVAEYRENHRRMLLQKKLQDCPGPKPADCTSVVVTGLPTTCKEEEVWALFDDCGVQTISMMQDRSGAFRGLAFVDLEDTKGAEKAATRNGRVLKGRRLFVRYKSDAAASAGSTPARNSSAPAPHNLPPPVPAFSGIAKKLDTDSEEDA